MIWGGMGQEVSFPKSDWLFYKCFSLHTYIQLHNIVYIYIVYTVYIYIVYIQVL